MDTWCWIKCLGQQYPKTSFSVALLETSDSAETHASQQKTQNGRTKP